jgi:hypothetical protein
MTGHAAAIAVDMLLDLGTTTTPGYAWTVGLLLTAGGLGAGVWLATGGAR